MDAVSFLNSTGVHFLNASVWSPADIVEGSLDNELALTDVSGHRLRIYFLWLKLSLYCDLPANPPTGTIFFFKVLTICAAVHAKVWHCAQHYVHRLAVLSDNSNSVAIFNSLRASPAYNPILESAVDVMLDCDLSVRIDHIPGGSNIIADALSCGKLDLV